MRGWTSFIIGFLLLAVAYWSFTVEGFASSTLIFAALAGFFFICGAAGREVTDTGGATAIIDFVSNPADAIVDSATDKLADWLQDDQPQATTATSRAAATATAPVPALATPIVVQPPKVVAEGAMDRYFAQREAEMAASAVQAPASSFGRKGL
jgi:thiol:disulfide interchange protein